jgi:hypothetical protein
MNWDLLQDAVVDAGMPGLFCGVLVVVLIFLVARNR